MRRTYTGEDVQFGTPLLTGKVFVNASVENIIILVHPWTWLGGRGSIVVDLALELSGNLNSACLAFDLRGAGNSQGWSTFSGRAEIADVKAAVEYMRTRFPGKPVFLIGYSAGACIAGSAAAPCQVDGYLGIAYPCGLLTSIAFSGHPPNLRNYQGPKILVSGDSDGFTSSSQLRGKFGDSKNTDILIIPGRGHFDILAEKGILLDKAAQLTQARNEQ